MTVFSANLNFLFTEVSFMERFQAAAQAGFKNVEFMFPYDYVIPDIKKELEQNNLQLVLINLPAGNWEGGDRGIAADPARKDEFRKGVAKAVEAAKLLGVPRANCLVGKVEGNYSPEAIQDNIMANLALAAEEFEAAGLDLMVEPVNHFDIPGFYLNTTSQVMDIIKQLKKPNVYLQYDVYHAAREEEDHDFVIDNYFDRIGHVQIADNPGRNQPGTGEINYEHVLQKLDDKGYKGFVGMEYKPQGTTQESLKWLQRYKLEL